MNKTMTKTKHPSVISEDLRALYFEPIKNGDEGAVQSLIDMGSSVVAEEDYLMWKHLQTSYIDGFGAFCPLALAVELKSYGIIELLLKNKANPNSGAVPWLPLVQAAKSNDTKAAELLIKNGADIDLVVREDGRKTTSVITAIKNRSYDVLKVLLKDEVNQDSDSPNKEFNLLNSAEIAVWDNDPETIKVLNSYVVDPLKLIKINQIFIDHHRFITFDESLPRPIMAGHKEFIEFSSSKITEGSLSGSSNFLEILIKSPPENFLPHKVLYKLLIGFGKEQFSDAMCLVVKDGEIAGLSALFHLATTNEGVELLSDPVIQYKLKEINADKFGTALCSVAKQGNFIDKSLLWRLSADPQGIELLLTEAFQKKLNEIDINILETAFCTLVKSGVENLNTSVMYFLSCIRGGDELLGKVFNNKILKMSAESVSKAIFSMIPDGLNKDTSSLYWLVNTKYGKELLSNPDFIQKVVETNLDLLIPSLFTVIKNGPKAGMSGLLMLVMHPEGRNLLANETIQNKIESLETNVLFASMCSTSQLSQGMTVLSALIGTLEGRSLLNTGLKKHVFSTIRILKEEVPDYALQTLSGKVISVSNLNIDDIPNIENIKLESVVDDKEELGQSLLISSSINQQVNIVGESRLIPEDTLNYEENEL